MNYTRILLLLILSLNSFNLVAQKRKQFKEKSMITNKNMTITVEGDYKHYNRNMTKKRYILVYVKKSDNLLLGNKCAEDVTKGFGFQYVIVPPNQQMKGSRFFFHNFWAKFKLFFKNGPFWGGRVRKLLKKCKKMTNDYVG